jgi:hypothetical protein
MQLLKKFPALFWNPKVYYRIHKSLPLIHSLNQINSVHVTPFYLSMISILSNRLRLGVPSGLLPSVFPTHNLYIYIFFSSFHSCYIPCTAHSPCFCHSNFTWRRVQFMKVLIMQSFLTSCDFIPLLSKYSPQTSISSVNDRDQVLNPQVKLWVSVPDLVAIFLMISIN